MYNCLNKFKKMSFKQLYAYIIDNTNVPLRHEKYPAP